MIRDTVGIDGQLVCAAPLGSSRINPLPELHNWSQQRPAWERPYTPLLAFQTRTINPTAIFSRPKSSPLLSELESQ